MGRSVPSDSLVGAVGVETPAIAEMIYGIPPEQVIGSSSKTQSELRDSTPVLTQHEAGLQTGVPI